MFAKMTIKEIYTKYIDVLKHIYSIGEATAITKIVFEHFAKISATEIVIAVKQDIEPTIIETLNVALLKLQNNIPVQYITGKAWFYNICFTVTNAVLIPRPETEELVLEAIKFLKNNHNKKVLDIGTGSGCIPICIKLNVPTASVTSLDVSEAALVIAKQNIDENKVEIDLLLFNFLDENKYTVLEKFDLIISNPPYIPENEKEFLDKNVTQFEPHLALFVPQKDPLLFYRKILIFAENHLEDGGKIFIEVHENFALETAAIFITANYEVTIKKDMQGKNRMLLIYRSLKQLQM